MIWIKKNFMILWSGSKNFPRFFYPDKKKFIEFLIEIKKFHRIFDPDQRLFMRRETPPSPGLAATGSPTVAGSSATAGDAEVSVEDAAGDIVANEGGFRDIAAATVFGPAPDSVAAVVRPIPIFSGIWRSKTFW